MNSRTLLALALAATLSTGVLAQKPEKPAAQKKPIVLGTQQLSGDFGQIGTTYTTGKSSPINFTLNSVELSVRGPSSGEAVHTIGGNEKVLVLHFTVHNPQPQEQRFIWSSLNFTAVDSKDVNYEYIQSMAREGTQNEIESDLKPAQKVDVMAWIRVPADAIVPKLIVKREQDAPVIRYDLRGKIKGLEAPFADPADKDGWIAREEVPAGLNTYYPFENLDLKLESVRYAKEALGGNELEEGKQYMTATFSAKNNTTVEQAYVWSRFEAILEDADGEKIDMVQELLKASRNEAAEGTLKPGEEYKFRFYFVLPENMKGKKLRLKEGGSRTYLFTLPS